MPNTLSKKPYIVRAFYQWIIDSGCTPYLMLNTKSKRVEVPRKFAKNNRIVLDISPTSVKELEIDNKYVYFKAKFQDKEETIYAPIEAVLSIYAAETGDGFVFDEEPIPDDFPPKKEDHEETKKSDGGFLKVVD